jgi:hypothetical protein
MVEVLLPSLAKIPTITQRPTPNPTSRPTPNATGTKRALVRRAFNDDVHETLATLEG